MFFEHHKLLILIIHANINVFFAIDLSQLFNRNTGLEHKQDTLFLFLNSMTEIVTSKQDLICLSY